MKVDNGQGAETSQHVSPTVAATRFPSVDNVKAILDTEAGPLPAASGAEGTPELRQTKAVQSDKLEH